MAEPKDATKTKERIMRTAAELFSEKGFNKVSIREIANAAGVNLAMIYYYFSSKDELLYSLYEFYSRQQQMYNPDLEKLLRLAETHSPQEVLAAAVYSYDEEVRDMLDRIIVTAAREVNSNPESERFVQESVFDNIEGILKPLLLRMVELGKIKPFDSDTFFRVLSYYCFSAAALNKSVFSQSAEEYAAGMAYLFSAIIPN